MVWFQVAARSKFVPLFGSHLKLCTVWHITFCPFFHSPLYAIIIIHAPPCQTNWQKGESCSSWDPAAFCEEISQNMRERCIHEPKGTIETGQMELCRRCNTHSSANRPAGCWKPGRQLLERACLASGVHWACQFRVAQWRGPENCKQVSYPMGQGEYLLSSVYLLC